MVSLFFVLHTNLESIDMHKTLGEYLNSNRLSHSNKKLKWTKLDNGNYLLSNNSSKKPISFEFKPATRVVRIECNTRLAEQVYVTSINNKKVKLNLINH